MIKKICLLIIILFVSNSGIAKPLPLKIQHKQIPEFQMPQNLMIPNGVEFDIVFTQSLSTQNIVVGQNINAQLAKDWFYNGNLIAPEGSILTGKVVACKPAYMAYGDGQITVNFQSINRPDGFVIVLPSKNIQITVDDSRSKNITNNLVLGLLNTLSSSDSTELIVNGINAAALALKKGEDAIVPVGTKLRLQLSSAIITEPY